MGKEVYQNTVYSKLTKGIVGNVPNQDVPKEASPDLLNMVLRDGKMETDKGYTKMGNIIYGRPALFYQFDRAGADNEILLFTDRVAYKWEGGIWLPLLDIFGGGPTTISSSPGGTYDLELSSSFYIVGGDFVGVELSNGEYHVSEVDSYYVDGGGDYHIVLVDMLLYGVNSGANVRRCAHFNGNPDNPPSAVTIAAEGIVVFTNNVDDIVYYDGDKIQPIADLLTYLTTCTCRSLMHMNGRLHLINTTENGTPWPHRIRSSATGDFTEFDPLAANSDASYSNVYDTSGELLLGKVMSNFAVLYKTDNVIKMTYVGSSTRTYRFDTMVSMAAAISTQAVVAKDSTHIIMGPEEIYTYKGTYDISNLSSAVKDKIYGTNGDLVNEYGLRTKVGFVDTYNEFWFLFIDDTDGVGTVLWKYNLNVGGWTYRFFNDDMLIFGEFNLESGITWESSECETNWNGDARWNVPWTDVTLSGVGNNIILGGIDKYGTYRTWIFGAAIDDDGVAIPSYYQTPEMITIDGTFRIDSLTVKGVGKEIGIQYTVDNGETWENYLQDNFRLDEGIIPVVGFYVIGGGHVILITVEGKQFEVGNIIEVMMDNGEIHRTTVIDVQGYYVFIAEAGADNISAGAPITILNKSSNIKSLGYNKYITHRQVTSERIMFRLTTEGLDTIEPFSFEWLKVAYMEESDY